MAHLFRFVDREASNSRGFALCHPTLRGELKLGGSFGLVINNTPVADASLRILNLLCFALSSQISLCLFGRKGV